MADSVTPPIETLLRERTWLARLAASLLVDATAAEDLAQQALLSALERPPPRAGKPRAWLGAVVRNPARRFVSSEERRAGRERAAASPERIPAADEAVARAALQLEVSAAVLALPDPYRATAPSRMPRADSSSPGFLAAPTPSWPRRRIWRRPPLPRARDAST